MNPANGFLLTGGLFVRSNMRARPISVNPAFHFLSPLDLAIAGSFSFAASLLAAARRFYFPPAFCTKILTKLCIKLPLDKSLYLWYNDYSKGKEFTTMFDDFDTTIQSDELDRAEYEAWLESLEEMFEEA